MSLTRFGMNATLELGKSSRRPRHGVHALIHAAIATRPRGVPGKTATAKTLRMAGASLCAPHPAP